MLKLENSIRGLSFSRVAFDLTIQGTKLFEKFLSSKYHNSITFDSTYLK